MSFRLSNLYNNVNNVFVKPPLNDCNYEAKIAYFGVMLSFGTGVFTLSGLISYKLFSLMSRNKMLNSLYTIIVKKYFLKL